MIEKDFLLSCKSNLKIELKWMWYLGIKCEIWRFGMLYGDVGYVISSFSFFIFGIRFVLVCLRFKWILDCLVFGVLGIWDGLLFVSIIKFCFSFKWLVGGGRW